MAKVTIDRDGCMGCGLCVEACPKKIVTISKTMNGKGYAPAECVNQETCIGCAFCARMCPHQVIKVEK